MAKSKIEWTDYTWNMIGGCTKVSSGCENCYALRDSYRIMHNPIAPDRYNNVAEKIGNCVYWTGKINLDYDVLDTPLRLKKPRTIFVESMGDLFHEDVPFSFIHDVFEIMRKASWHTFQILTKRAKRMLDFVAYIESEYCDTWSEDWFPNVWMGITAENQRTLEDRMKYFRYVKSKVKFISVEPMLGCVHFTDYTKIPTYTIGFSKKEVTYDYVENNMLDNVDLVICGGETGSRIQQNYRNLSYDPVCRPVHVDDVRLVRDMCVSTNTKFFFKQWGDWIPECQMDEFQKELSLRVESFEWPDGSKSFKLGKRYAGSMLDGVSWDQIP